MEINSPPSNEVLDFCNSFKKSFKEHGWPNSKIETWKMTPLQKFIKDTSSLKHNSKYLLSNNKNKFIKNVDINNLEFLNSKYFQKNEMSRVILSHISNAFEILVPKNTSKKETIDIKSSIDAGIWSSSLIIIKVPENVECNLALEFSLSSNSLCTPLIAIDVGKGSNLSFGLSVINSSKSLNASNFVSLIEGDLSENSNLEMVLTQQGVTLSRSDININLNQNYSNYDLIGVYFGREKQHQDITTCVNHLAENTSSNQIIRGILDDSSVGVYQGGVKVAPNAQKTDGRQMSRALLLSNLAESNSKPELEIFADDVSCAHGATIGELDKDQFFYLLSRGVSHSMARELLIKAYLNEVVEEIQNDYLSDKLEKAIDFWLSEFKMKEVA